MLVGTWGSHRGRLEKIEAVGSLLAPVSPALEDFQEGRVRHGRDVSVLGDPRPGTSSPSGDRR